MSFYQDYAYSRIARIVDDSIRNGSGDDDVNGLVSFLVKIVQVCMKLAQISNLSLRGFNLKNSGMILN